MGLLSEENPTLGCRGLQYSPQSQTGRRDLLRLDAREPFQNGASNRFDLLSELQIEEAGDFLERFFRFRRGAVAVSAAVRHAFVDI
jgi:hypothetical protein